MKLDTSAAPELSLLAAPPAAVTTAAFAAGAALSGHAAPGQAVTGNGCPNSASLARSASAAGTVGPAEDNQPDGGAAPGLVVGDRPGAGARPGLVVGDRPGAGARPGLVAGGGAASGVVVGDRPGGGAHPADLARPVTVGYLAACLRFLVEDPGRWWDLVRFDPQRPVRIPVTAPAPGCETWLLVLPPGNQDKPHGETPRGGASCLVAGAVTEQVSTTAGWQDRPLACGRTRVHGSHGPSRLVSSGSGYAVTLHARPLRG